MPKTRVEISLDPSVPIEAEILATLETIKTQNGRRSLSEVVKEILTIFAPAAAIEMSIRHRQQRAIASIPPPFPEISVSFPETPVELPGISENFRESPEEFSPIVGW